MCHLSLTDTTAVLPKNFIMPLPLCGCHLATAGPHCVQFTFMDTQPLFLHPEKTAETQATPKFYQPHQSVLATAKNGQFHALKILLFSIQSKGISCIQKVYRSQPRMLPRGGIHLFLLLTLRLRKMVEVYENFCTSRNSNLFRELKVANGHEMQQNLLEWPNLRAVNLWASFWLKFQHQK